MNFNINEIKERLEKVKVIYMDVDGTFVHNGCLFCTKYGFTLKNASAIYDLLSAGVDIVMTSGELPEGRSRAFVSGYSSDVIPNIWDRSGLP